MKQRCSWVPEDDELYISYHDEEWGVPVYDDRKLFEFLILEGAQAGLSWRTILARRDGYRDAFASFDAETVAQFTTEDVERLKQNEAIIRNRLKIEAAVNNAQRFIEIQKEFGSFSNYQWQFVAGKPIQNNWADSSQVPAITHEAEAFSKDLKKRGFKFVGPTIIYAHMQAIGMVNDHTLPCFRHAELKSKNSSDSRSSTW